VASKGVGSKKAPNRMVKRLISLLGRVGVPSLREIVLS